MKRRSPSAAKRLRRMHDKLVDAYGPQLWWPAHTPFEVILGAYLTQNTSWKAVERSLANLRAAGALSLEGLRALSLEELRRLIQPSGFFTRKAPALKAFVAMVDDEYGASLEHLAAAPTDALRRRLLALPGVGPETADAILLYALGHAVPVADEYLRRLVERHRLIAPAPGKNRSGYEALTGITREAFVADPQPEQAQLFNEFHALTVAVGKGHCGRVARCEGCPLAYDLPPAKLELITGSCSYRRREDLWSRRSQKRDLGHPTSRAQLLNDGLTVPAADCQLLAVIC